MDRRNLISAALMGTLITSSATAATSTDDAREVSNLLAEYQASWNAGDAARMFRLATDDIHWINIVGMHWQGKAQVELAHRIYLGTMFRGVPLTLEEVESIMPAGPQVLIVVARWNMGAFTPPDGQPVPPSKDRMSLVLRRTSNGLRIAHGANVQINEAVQQFDPARGKPSG